MKTFVLLIFVITFSFAQNRFLLHIDKNGRQEAVAIKKNETTTESIKRFRDFQGKISSVAFLDSLKYFANNSNLTYEFGNLEEEMMLQWYEPGADGFVREVWWSISSDVGETKEVNVRLWYPHPRLKNIPTTQLQKNMGYYRKSDDPVNLVTPFRELATDTTWVYPLKTSDSLQYAFDPLGIEATWKKGGVNAPVQAYSWHVVDLLATGDTMKFLEDQLIGFTIQNTATSSNGVRQEVTSLANPDPPFHSYKFYPRGRLSSEDRGWWLRGDFEWGMYMVVEYSSPPKPKITSQKLLNTAITQQRKLTTTIKTQNVSDPVDVLLFTKIGKESWQSTSMFRESGFEFGANVPSAVPGDSVYYYITAKDAQNRTTQSSTFGYQIHKKNNPLLLIFNGKILPSGIVDPSIYIKFTMKTDFGKEPYYDFTNVSKYTLKELPALLEQYNAILEVTGEGGLVDISKYSGEWLENSSSLPAGKKRYYLWSDQEHGFISNYSDTIFSDNDVHVKYFGVKGIVNQDFPRKQNNFKSVTFPWQLNTTSQLQSDIIFGFIPNYLSTQSVTLWYHPYYEVPLFTNLMDEIQPASNSEILFSDKQSNKVVGVRTIDPNNRWQSYFLAFDWMALDVRGDTSSTLYQYPFLDPKYKWIVDIQNIGKTFANLPGITNVENSNSIPSAFVLHQNYPNPFNPTTKIEYEIPFRQHVTLKIYDLLGKEVASLADEIKSPGIHTHNWNASNFPSGMYFYRLSAGNFSGTKKLLLLK